MDGFKEAGLEWCDEERVSGRTKEFNKAMIAISQNLFNGKQSIYFNRSSIETRNKILFDRSSIEMRNKIVIADLSLFFEYFKIKSTEGLQPGFSGIFLFNIRPKVNIYDLSYSEEVVKEKLEAKEPEFMKAVQTILPNFQMEYMFDKMKIKDLFKALEGIGETYQLLINSRDVFEKLIDCHEKAAFELYKERYSIAE